MEKTYDEYINKKENEVYVNDPYRLKTLNIKRWQKENIDDIKEKNKITVETLTNELEKALGVNKNAVLERKAELEKLKTSVDNAETTYNNLNPNPDDIKLSEEYERIKAELDKLNEEILLTDARIKALKEALTLNDLTNIGENQIAYGTEALAVGNDTIAIGTKASSVGNSSISIGKESTTTGDNSLTIGAKSISVGNSINSIGNTNIVYGDNNLVFGNNNKIGEDNAKKTNNILIGNNIISTVNNAIVLGNGSTAVANAISVGSVKKERQIKFVKEGTDDTDAVNKKQLETYVANHITPVDTSNFVTTDKLIEKIGEINKTMKDLPKTENIINKKLDKKVNIDGSNIETTEDKTKFRENISVYSKKEVDNYVNSNNIQMGSYVKNEVQKLNTKITKTGAIAMASSALHPIAYDKYKPSQIMASISNYGGNSTAVALGMAHYINSDNLLTCAMSLAVDNTGKDVGISLGYTHRFGGTSSLENDIEKENEILKNKLKALENKVDTLMKNLK